MCNLVIPLSDLPKRSRISSPSYSRATRTRNLNSSEMEELNKFDPYPATLMQIKVNDHKAGSDISFLSNHFSGLKKKMLTNLHEKLNGAHRKHRILHPLSKNYLLRNVNYLHF